MQQRPSPHALELLIESVRDYAIFMLDPTGHVQTWNRGAQLIKGYRAEEIIGQRLERFYTEVDRFRGLPDKLLGIAREEGRVESEGWRVRKDGTRFWADVIITALRDADGTLVGFAKVTRDLTERRAAEEERLQAEQRFRLMVESVQDYAIFMLDPTGHVATWNPGAERVKGYKADEIIGSHFSRFYPPEDIVAGRAAMELVVALQEGRYEDEGWRLRKDGSRFWANVVITPAHDQAGTHIGFVKVTRDLTDRVEGERQKIRLAQTEEAVRLRDEFLSIASHELKTPLMALRLQLDSALETPALPPKVATKVQRAQRSVVRLADLVEGLLDVSRLSIGQMNLSPARVDVAALLTEVVDGLHEASQQAECKLSVELQPGILATWDAMRVGQVVMNLLTNSFKYAAGHDVELKLARDGEVAVITVRDHGAGVANEQLDRIFGRFERAHSTRHFGGMGLGLYVAREIVRAHEGTITASNHPEGGATFITRIPLEPSSKAA